MAGGAKLDGSVVDSVVAADAVTEVGATTDNEIEP